MRLSCLCLTFALLVVSGCESTQTETYELDQPSGFCLLSGESPGDPRTLTVLVGPDCFSSSCSTIEEESCSYTVDGNRILVEASIVVSERDGICTEDCRTLSASCELGDLPEGEYEVVDAANPDGAAFGTFAVPDDGRADGCQSS